MALTKETMMLDAWTLLFVALAAFMVGLLAGFGAKLCVDAFLEKNPPPDENARLRKILGHIATMDCLTREGDEAPHLLMMRLARDALVDVSGENVLPVELLPEGWMFKGVETYGDTGTFRCELSGVVVSDLYEASGVGPSPRAAMLAAIEAARHE